MTHFRPICLMPLSASNNAHNIVTVPPLRQKNIKRDILKIYKPIKTKFRKKLTSVHRRSAFCIFQSIKPLLNVGKLTKSKSNLNNVQNETRQHETSGTDESQLSTETFEPVINSTGIMMNRAQKSATAKTVQTRKTNNLKSCDSSSTMIKQTRSSRDKMLQEKEDFQLAKMLQECVGTGDTSNRYSLRSRNKSSVSSLSSGSSNQDYFHTKGYPLAVSKFKRNNNTTSFNDVNGAMVTRQQRNNTIATANNEKFIDFSFQKLTRSRRIAMTMTGV